MRASAGIGDEIAPVARGAEEPLDRTVDERAVAALVKQLQLQGFDLALGSAARSAVAAMIMSAPRIAERTGDLIAGDGQDCALPMARPTTSEAMNDQRPRTAMAIDGLASF